MKKRLIFLIVVLWLLSVFKPLILSAQVEVLKGVGTVSLLMADENPNTLAGAYYDFVSPGDRVIHKYTVINSKPEPVSVRVFASDVQPALNGGKGFKSYGSEMTGVGSWYITEDMELELGASESKTVEFILDVPNDIIPGQYISYVVVEEFTQISQQDEAKDIGYTLDVTMNTGIQVILDYESDKAEPNPDIVELTHVYYPQGTLVLEGKIENTGTVLVKPHLELTVTDTDTVVYESSLQMDSLYGLSVADIRLPINEILMAGSYLASIEGVYPDGTFSYEYRFDITKEEVTESLRVMEEHGVVEVITEVQNELLYIMIGVVVFLLLLIIIILVLLLRKKDKQSDKGNTSQVLEETIDTEQEDPQ